MNDLVKTILVRIDLVRVGTAFTILIVFLFMNYALVFIVIPKENREILHNMVGIIEGVVMTLVSFEFGSSKGAQPKDKSGDTVQTDKSETPKQ